MYAEFRLKNAVNFACQCEGIVASGEGLSAPLVADADAEDPQPEFQTKKKTGPSRRQSEGQVSSPGTGAGPKPKKKRAKKRPTRKSMPELAPEDDDSGGFE
jgi:hypothetical protein